MCLAAVPVEGYAIEHELLNCCLCACSSHPTSHPTLLASHSPLRSALTSSSVRHQLGPHVTRVATRGATVH
eukprot:1003067-Prymnesium_polylepis.3